MVLIQISGKKSLIPGPRPAAVAHRADVDAVDKLTGPTLATVAKNDNVTGVMAASEHKAAVAPGNRFGSAGASNIVTITPTVNKTVDLTVPKVTGADYYDVFYTTDAAPLWVARVTEAQRASGCSITAVGTVTTTDGDGWTKSAGKVNIRLVGTGLGTNAAPFTVNNAYNTAGITAIDCSGYTYAYIYATLTVDDLRALPTLKIAPLLSSASNFFQGSSVVDLAPGSAAGKPLVQYTTVTLYGAESLAVLVDTLSGEGAVVDIDVELV